MKISFLSILMLVILAFPASTQSPTAMVTMNSVEPVSGKVGFILTIHGTNLGQDSVTALYLTDGKTDIKVQMIEQASELIRFRIPPEAKPGRFALMVLTGKGEDQKLVEQPVKITVEGERTGPTVTS